MKQQVGGFRIGEIVDTPNGRGKISKFEEFRLSERLAVELDNNPFNFPLAYYFPKELKKVNIK